MNTRLGFTTAALGLVLISVNILHGGWTWVLAWLGLSFLCIALGHLGFGAHILGKRKNGSLAAWSLCVYLPLHLYTYALWHIVNRLSREDAWNRVNDHLSVGRRLTANETAGEFTNWLDLTAEFHEPKNSFGKAHYISFPIMDGGVPTVDAVRETMSKLTPGNTYVHCAQGHGRTGLMAAILLVANGTAANTDDAIATLVACRPKLRLNSTQRRFLEEIEPVITKLGIPRDQLIRER